MKRGGFSVIEGVAVIGIIAVLAGVSAAIYSSVKERAKAAGCAGNLRELGMALNRYQADHEGVLPTMLEGRKSLEEDVAVMDNVLAEYVESHQVFGCPGDHGGVVTETGASYLWNKELSGRQVAGLEFFDSEGIAVFSDKENFHERKNVLYADGHLGTDLEYSVGKK